MRRAIEDQLCPWCGEGPWRSLSLHTNLRHGWSADDLREIAELPPSEATISDDTIGLLTQIGRERESERGVLARYREEHPDVIAEAIKRATEVRAKAQREATHCHRGHALAGDNLRVDADGFRKCRICRKEAPRHLLTDEQWEEQRRYVREYKKSQRRKRGMKPMPPKMQESCGCSDKCRIPVGDHRHGSTNGYNNFRCRCQPCKDANTAHMAEKRLAATQSVCPSCGGPGGVYAGRCRPCYQRRRKSEQDDAA